MEKMILKSGLTALYYPKKGNSVVVEVMIKVGSIHEKVMCGEFLISWNISCLEGTKKSTY